MGIVMTHHNYDEIILIKPARKIDFFLFFFYQNQVPSAFSYVFSFFFLSLYFLKDPIVHHINVFATIKTKKHKLSVQRGEDDAL